jgi:methylmalonyl-CoA mutase N-terminal domain/subunit
VFASTNKKDVKLDAKWESLAAKELKGKDMRQVLIRETNEQMLVKPLYTKEDWKAPEGQSEVPGELSS